MLVTMRSNDPVKKLPHKDDFLRWRANISDAEYDLVVNAINAKIDTSDINTSGWMPGHDWSGTVYEPLYHACGKNVVQAGWFFGIIVFKTLMERTDHVWCFDRFEMNGKPIKSMTYFITKLDPKSLK